MITACKCIVIRLSIKFSIIPCLILNTNFIHPLHSCGVLSGTEAKQTALGSQWTPTNTTVPQESSSAHFEPSQPLISSSASWNNTHYLMVGIRWEYRLSPRLFSIHRNGSFCIVDVTRSRECLHIHDSVACLSFYIKCGSTLVSYSNAMNNWRLLLPHVILSLYLSL